MFAPHVRFDPWIQVTLYDALWPGGWPFEGVRVGGGGGGDWGDGMSWETKITSQPPEFVAIVSLYR